jgi:pyrroline-5-carboxylate reductase
MKIGIIGLGQMGEAIAEGLRRSLNAGTKGKSLALEATTSSQDSAREASQKLGIECHTDNARLVSGSKLILLCVKPHHAEKVLKSVAGKLTAEHLLISICASITTEQLSAWSGGRCRVIRAMPNTPCLIGEGMTVLCGGPGLAPEQMNVAENIFNALGRTAVVEESLMDGVTGLSGCGPAYVYLMIEALSEAGVKVGLPRRVATLLAAQTLSGAARMVIERGEHPASLKDEVTTPAGCTVDGLMALEEGKLRVTLIKAVLAATKRSKTLRGQ